MPEILIAQSDFQIPRPQGQEEAPAAPPPAAPSPSGPGAPAAPMPDGAGSGLLVAPFLPRPVSGTEIAVGGGLFVLLLAVFFAVKLSVTRGLQARSAAPGPASEAGWLLFAFLAVAALALIAAYIGDLWRQVLVVGPAGAVALLLLVLFLAKRSAALKTRR